MSVKQKQPKQSKFNLLQLPRQIYKFGGSSLTSARCYYKVARLITKHLTANDLVVVSASGQTTDWLIALATATVNRYDYLHKVRYYYQNLIHDCLTDNQQARLLKVIEQDCLWLQRLIELERTQQHQNEIVALGELWSAQILACVLESESVNASWIDARQFLRLHKTTEGYEVCLKHSQKNLYENLKSRQNRISIVTGFIASDSESNTLTLGRNGSDYTATLLAQLTSAPKVTLWTDVAGIYNFDPNLTEQAQPLHQINRNLLLSLSKLGSPVIHLNTLAPLKNEKIDLSIRSTFAPELTGTVICQENAFTPNAIITHKNNMVELSLSVTDEINTQRVINELRSYALNNNGEFILVIKRSPHQVAVLVNEERKDYWLGYIKQHQLTTRIEQVRDCCFIALVTENNGDKPFHRQFLTQAVARCNHVYFTAQNNADIAVIYQRNGNDLAIDCFEKWQKFQKTQAIFLLGTGNVGKTWYRQWQTQAPDNQAVVVTANSHYLKLQVNQKVFSQIENSTEQLVRLIKQSPFAKKIIIDATASDTVANSYTSLLKSGAHIISANKLCVSGNEAQFQQLQRLARENNTRWQYNATLGAGLPVNYTIKNMVTCGDRITRIRGVFSGTLSWLLQTYNGKQPLSQLIKQAQQKGYSEPDPRQDLSGNDVARKLVIAARLAGYQLELADIKCAPLIEPQWLQGTQQAFWDNAEQFDKAFDDLWQTANSRHQALVYQAEFNAEGDAVCQLTAVDKTDPLAQISPCDNIFVIHSLWYKNNPLIIRGAGAGREVTAGAIQSDLNNLG